MELGLCNRSKPRGQGSSRENGDRHGSFSTIGLLPARRANQVRKTCGPDRRLPRDSEYPIRTMLHSGELRNFQIMAIFMGMKKTLPARKSGFVSGFTLVELLVVIVIIAALTAIGFPVAKRMKEAAARTQCMTQLRSWAVAIGGYSADHDGKIEWEPWPSIGTDPLHYSPYVSYWTGDSEDSSGFEAQLKQRCCPAIGWKRVSGGPNSPVTYATIQPVGVAAVGITGRAEKGLSSAYSASLIKRPSKFMLMIDATGAGYSVSTATQFQAKVKPLTVAGKDARHQQTVNALLADYSVRAMTWSEINRGMTNWSTF